LEKRERQKNWFTLQNGINVIPFRNRETHEAMAKQGDGITNYRTGQRMVFIWTGKETKGQLLKINTFNPEPL
jgi:hypothetical protein